MKVLLFTFLVAFSLQSLASELTEYDVSVSLERGGNPVEFRILTPLSFTCSAEGFKWEAVIDGRPYQSACSPATTQITSDGEVKAQLIGVVSNDGDLILHFSHDKCGSVKVERPWNENGLAIEEQTPEGCLVKIGVSRQ